MFERRTRCEAVVLAVGLLCGCAGRHVWEEREVSPAFDHSFIGKIAVVEFENRTADPMAGRNVADRIEALLANESDYDVISRMDLGWILKEHNLLVKGPIDPETMRQLGKVAGVDALVLGIVDTYQVDEMKLKPLKVARTASVDLRIKAVDASSGRVVWSKRARGSLFWKGWVDTYPMVTPRECLQEALAKAVAEVRSLFPHKVRVKRRVEE